MTVRTKDLPIRPVILSGGAGSRLWPISRLSYPKQLLAIAEADTMLQATAARVQATRFSPIVVVAGEDHRFLVKEQLEASGARLDAIILEPEGRNTAAAIAAAAQYVTKDGADEIMLVMPSDHVISDLDAFQAAVEAALPAVQKGMLATFGIKAGGPETGYGYIEAGETIDDAPAVRAVKRFIEKPDLEAATTYVEQGNFYWNGGIFLFSARTFLEELAMRSRQVAEQAERAMAESMRDGDFVRPEPSSFLASENTSVDYAVMEKTDRACVIPVDMGWSDLGSWNAVWENAAKDASGNAIHGNALALDTKRSLLRSETETTIAAVGIEDLIVVATRDAVLVVPRDRAQDTKLVVDALKGSGRPLHNLHMKVHRPWGSYETMDQGHRFQTKRIIVKPGAKLSLQLHHHRSEHWVVVSGSAEVTVGDRVTLLQENESTYIPAGTPHRLGNPGKLPLHLIEVQCGPYLGEDDIVRLDDSYGRS